jgi:hypothetical protein
MRMGGTRGIALCGLATLAFSLALPDSSLAGALTASAWAGSTSIPSTSQIAAAWHNISANLSPFPLSSTQFEWRAGSASAVSGTYSLGLERRTTVETPIKWQSSLNVAGSRVWSKFIKFSPTGINVRLPLN